MDGQKQHREVNTVEQKLPDEAGGFWKAIKDRVKENLESEFGSELNRTDEFERKDERIERMMAREKTFVTSVLSRVERAREERGGDMVILFDINETIGSTKFVDGNNFHTLLRPSLMPMMEKLRAMGIKIGFISNWGKEAMERQLQDTQDLESLREYITPKYIYSTRVGYEQDLPYRSVEELAQKLKETFGGDLGVVDDALLGAEGEYPDSSGDYEKLFFLKKIQSELNGKTVIVVDDLDYPKYLDKKKGFYGVSLGGRGAFFKP